MDKWIEVVRDRLLDGLALEAYSLQAQPVQLSSGEMSNEYLDCRHALGAPETLHMASAVVWASLDQSVRALGGLTMGADPISIGVSLYSSQGTSVHRVRWFSVRKTPKSHGWKQSIEGQVWPDERVTVVEDVVNSGASTIKAVQACREARLDVVQIVTLVDREVGGLAAIEAATGIKPIAIFTKEAIADRYRDLHLD